MKFAVLALLGFATASQISLPVIEWNDAAVQKLDQSAQNYFQAAAIKDRNDKEQLVKDFSYAVAKKDVADRIAFSKTFKPLFEDKLEFIKQLNVGAECNQEAATQCLNSYF